MVIVACLLVFWVGFVAIRREQTRRQNIIREDITAAIFEEETQRFLGRGDDIPIVANASIAWQEAYRQSFQYSPFDSPPQSINITNLHLEPDTSCANIIVALANLHQKRRYCQSRYGWLRVPMPPSAWGQELLTIAVDSNIVVKLPGGDEQFGQILKRDILLIKQTLSQQGLWPVPEPALNIIIAPQEFKGPLIDRQPQQIVLNSPWATSLQPDTGLAGTAAVRLALGEALLMQISGATLDQSVTLPGANRFLEATRTIIAMRMLLSPEQQTSLVNHWHNQLDDQWVSPFFADFYPGEAQQAQVAAKVTANTFPSEALIDMMQQIPSANSWDSLFQSLSTSASLNTIEAKAAAGIGQGPASSIPFVASPVLTFPLPAQLIQLNTLSPERTIAQVVVAGRPLFVEIQPQTIISTQNDDPLPIGCAGPQSKLEIEGSWLETHQRLAASKITVSKVAPLAIEPTLPDAQAYLFTGSPQAPQALLAVAGNATQIITPLSDTLRATSLPVAYDQAPHFLIKVDLPTCDSAWFGHYLPDQGVDQWWLAPPDLTQWVWQADRQNLIYLGTRGSDGYYDIYESNHNSIMPQVIGRSGLSQKLLGWNIARKQLVSQVSAPDEGYFLALIDPASGEMVPRSYYAPLRGRSLNPSGEWLAFMLSTISVTFPANHQEVINMLDGSFDAVSIILPGEGFWPAVWSPIIEQPQLVMLAGPSGGDDATPVPIRLMLGAPMEENSSITLAQAAPGEHFASPVICSNGDVLYLVEKAGRYRLVRQRPGADAQTVLEMGQAMYPLACP